MRELKFRTWNTDIRPNPIMEYLTLSESPKKWHLLDKQMMQFTGLYDKNNKEIYEGDLVRLYHSEEGEIICSVEWVQIWAGYYIDGDRRLNHKMNLEVIGNIYEHSDQLVNFRVEKS